LLQFIAQRELHKERFDEFIGVINIKWLKGDRRAFTRRAPESLLARPSTIGSDVNRQVRLENRRIVSTRKIVDDSLKETVHRLGWYQPVGNDDVSSHEPGTMCGSTPLLQLNNIAFRISRINHAKQTNAVHFCRGNFSHRAAACCNHCLQRLIDIVDRKCNVREATLISSRRFAFDQLIVAENLERRSIVPVSGQKQMNSAQMRVWDRVDAVEPRAGQIAFRTFRFASEYFAIESNQSFPICGDQIGVHVFGANWHFVLDRTYNYHNASAHVILSEAKNL
jgi:hypothetical protein